MTFHRNPALKALQEQVAAEFVWENRDEYADNPELVARARQVLGLIDFEPSPITEPDTRHADDLWSLL